MAVPEVNYFQENRAIAALVAPVPQAAAVSATASPPPPAADPSPQPTEQSVPAAPETTMPPAPIVTTIVPVQIYIPAISVNTKVIPRPSEFVMDEHLGYKVWQFGVPTGGEAMYQVAWWSSGPKPGAASSQLVVLLGHTQINGYGVFNDVGMLTSGSPVVLESNNHIVMRYRVISAVDGIDKANASALESVLSHPPDGAKLALITCSGGVNPAIVSHKDNTVVFAGLATS